MIRSRFGLDFTPSYLNHDHLHIIVVWILVLVNGLVLSIGAVRTTALILILYFSNCTPTPRGGGGRYLRSAQAMAQIITKYESNYIGRVVPTTHVGGNAPH